MKFYFNLKKRHVFSIIGIVFFVGVVIAYNGNQPNVMGHTDGEIRLPALNQNLDAWSGSVESRLTNLAGSNFQIAPGSSVYAGTFTWSSTANPPNQINQNYLQTVIPKHYLNSIDNIRFVINDPNVAAGGAFFCQQGLNVICGQGNPASNSWTCTCSITVGSTTNPQNFNILTGAGSCTGNTNWITFSVQGGIGDIGDTGFSSVNVEFCHATGNFGEAVIDMYVTPYVMINSNGQRFGMPVSI